MRTIALALVAPIVTLAMTVASRGSDGAQTLPGAFALQGGTARTAGHLRALSVNASPLSERLTFWMTTLQPNDDVASYDVEMTKRLHMIIVSDDFKTFMHVHPIYGSDDRFTIEQRFPRPGLYHVYADAVPHGLGQQVFRFDLPIGTSAPVARTLPAASTTVETGPYDVILSSNVLNVRGESRIAIHVLKNGKPAPDMQTYLGAAAHAVFLDARDLSYVHAHPMPLDPPGGATTMPMNGMPMSDAAMSSDVVPSAAMALHARVDEPGTYALWLQFRAGGQLHVAPFVVTAR
jgi:hypothetical protein